MSQRTNHPLILVGSNHQKIAYISMEHSDKWGHQKNVQFSINPEPSFFRKKVFIGKPSELGHALNQWHLSNIDKETLDKFLLKSSINFYK